MSLDPVTLLFQAVNFLVLVFVLHRLLWRPLRRRMSDRTARISEGLEQAARGQAEAARLRDEAQRAFERSGRVEAEALRHAEVEGEARRAQLLEEARRDAAAERDRLLLQVQAEQRREEAEFLHNLAPTIGRILQRILDEVDEPELLHRTACERFGEHLASLPEEERRGLEEAAGTAPVKILTARKDVPERFRSSLAGALPDSARAEFREEPRLVAGASLRIGDLVYDGSLAAQIRRALEAGS